MSDNGDFACNTPGSTTMNTFAALFHGLSVRSKLLYGYAAAFLLVIAMGNSILYVYVRDTIESNIESELKNTTSSILNMVQAAVDASITNHLRAVAEKNLEIVHDLYNRYREGEFSEEEARSRAAKILSGQTLGKTGYIYCLDSAGIIRVHPNKDLIGTNLSEHNFIHKQKQKKQGYIEYDWANPGEDASRSKALYMTYFGPWDWIISASSYRNEFGVLFSVEDLRSNILSIKFGETGYPYIMDTKGNLLVHPLLEGTNIFDSRDSSGRTFIKEICERRNGRIIYPWKNPGDPAPREKLVVFNHIPELDWIVASSSYLEEFYRPLRTVTYMTAITVVLMLLFILPLTWFLSGTITRPLVRLTSAFEAGSDNNAFERLEVTGNDEISRLTACYNTFMDRLGESRERLALSEEKYRSIFENAVEGVFQSTPDGRFLSVNPAMAAIFGYDSPGHMLRSISDISAQMYADQTHRDELFDELQKKKIVPAFETRMRRRDGSIIWVLLNARAVRDENGDLKHIEGLLTDISQRKTTEDELRAAKNTLEKRVEERTAQLSGWVRKLKRRNTVNALLQDMGDMLQTCRTREETYPVIRRYLSALFPEDDASLYVFDESRSLLVPVVGNGSSREDNGAFHPDDCWALRQGKPYTVTNPNTDIPCSHVNSLQSSCICVPLIAYGNVTGLLHLKFKASCIPGDPESADDEYCITDLPARLADHLALTLANLKLREELKLQSLQDALTGLYNRRHLKSFLDQMLYRFSRHAVPFAFLMMDVDHFKSVNDTHGHDTGDNVLRSLAKFLRDNTRDEDMVCRFGGEEFALILAGTDLHTAKLMSGRLHEGIRNHHVSDETGLLHVTVSIGTAVCPDHGTTAEDLLRAADEALYRAKEEGRNRVVIAETK